ncbi:MAG: methyltransferase type 11 [Campylobacteraceae bacterium 4484_4]|nr:MAG: methyltransferase type 11 [Campylobacteraceae bacterium 4484_4]
MAELRQEDSKVEVRGWEARYYDLLMNLITFGWYPKFIRRVIRDLELKAGDRILDLGAGTGRNALLMREYIGDSGEIVGLEIGPEMQAQFLQKSIPFDNIHLENLRIDELLPYKERFDLVFISFVLHGFIPKKREQIIKNAYNALKPGGIFAILDYNEFEVDSAPWYIRFAIRKVECPLAENFIGQDLKGMLERAGFGAFETKTYFKNHLRLLKAKKVPKEK